MTPWTAREAVVGGACGTDQSMWPWNRVPVVPSTGGTGPTRGNIKIAEFMSDRPYRIGRTNDQL